MVRCLRPHSIAGSVKVLAERDNAVAEVCVHEVGIVDYPGAQVACILGLTDMFGVLPRLPSISGEPD